MNFNRNGTRIRPSSSRFRKGGDIPTTKNELHFSALVEIDKHWRTYGGNPLFLT
jgi:hypothetical protein